MEKSNVGSAVQSSNLLSGIDALANPDYHELNRRGERLLHAVLCAYAKHHLDSPNIGWEQLSDILLDAICETIGDDEFCAWSKRITDNIAMSGGSTAAGETYTR